MHPVQTILRMPFRVQGKLKGRLGSEAEDGQLPVSLHIILHVPVHCGTQQPILVHCSESRASRVADSTEHSRLQGSIVNACRRVDVDRKCKATNLCDISGTRRRARSRRYSRTVPCRGPLQCMLGLVKNFNMHYPHSPFLCRYHRQSLRDRQHRR